MYTHNYEDLNPDRLQRLNKYRFMTLAQLQLIKPCWEDEPWTDFSSFAALSVPSLRLLQSAYCLTLPFDQLFTYDVNDFRYVTTLERWEKGLPVYRPSVGLDRDQKIIIEDGRHRSVLNNYLGNEFTPITVNKFSEAAIEKLLR